MDAGLASVHAARGSIYRKRLSFLVCRTVASIGVALTGLPGAELVRQSTSK